MNTTATQTETTIDEIAAKGNAALAHSEEITTTLADSIKAYDLDKLISRVDSLSSRILSHKTGSREVARLAKKLAVYQAELATRIS